MEIKWQPVLGYLGYYVSNYGDVKGVYLNRKQKILKKYKMKRFDRVVRDGNFYEQVSLSCRGKVVKRLVHRLVAEAFIGLPPKMCVNHKDGKKYNNHLSNLEVVTESQNKKHASTLGLMSHGEQRYNSKLNRSSVIKIKKSKGQIDQKTLAHRYGISQPVISRIQNKLIWKKI